jgi:peptidoglycan-associated lipoprotein
MNGDENNMANSLSRKTLVASVLATAVLAGCSSYIKREEFDATVAELRATDARLQAELGELSQKLGELSQKYDAIVTELAGRVRVETGAHFGFDDATLSDQDKPLLDDFAGVIRESHPNALITVEGFADPAGSEAYNKALGLRRAEAVREYLISSGGLSADQVRAVSYGESENRLVAPGAAGPDDGRPNRRVALVIDDVGVRSTAAM